MTVIVRDLRAEDEPQWRKLWTGYLEFYETSVPEEVYQTYFQRLLGDDPQDYHGLVAERDGELIGLTHYLFHRHGWRIENVIYLQDLYVSEAARGTGAGRGGATGPSPSRRVECRPQGPLGRCALSRCSW